MIKLRITTAGGTKIELDIPIDDSTPASIESAVPYQPEPVTPVETPTETQDAVVRLFDEPTPIQPATDLEEAMWKYKTSPTFPSNQDLKPTGKRYTSVESMVEDTCPEILDAFRQSLQQGEGEKGEDGRIGGVGERKEDGEKGKPERSIAFDFKFMCKGKDDYTPPDLLVQNHLAAYGEEFVIAQYREAQNWLLTNTHKLKTLGGTGKYLSGWLKRSKKYQDEEARKLVAQPVRVFQKADNLLSNANTQTEGW
jgi:hypothetical protein